MWGPKHTFKIPWGPWPPWPPGSDAYAAGLLFHFWPGNLLTRPKLIIELHTVLAAIHENPGRYSGHSFRAGAATTASVVGIKDS